jgi:antitoxin HicB
MVYCVRREIVPARRTKGFSIRFEPADEGGFVVSIPEMPGCVTQGETFQEGLTMVKDALGGLLSVALEEGDPIPEQLRTLVNELVPSFATTEPKRRARQAARSPAR